jgi:hypothetical protein
LRRQRGKSVGGDERAGDGDGDGDGREEARGVNDRGPNDRGPAMTATGLMASGGEALDLEVPKVVVDGSEAKEDRAGETVVKAKKR